MKIFSRKTKSAPKTCRLNRAAFIISVLLSLTKGYGQTGMEMPNTPTKGPTEVAVTIDINKIYNVNALEESFEVDGYLVLSWRDVRNELYEYDSNLRTYMNRNVDKVIESMIWFPYHEFINILSLENVPNKSISISPEGRVIYTERFKGKFYSEMNFERFPFDSQNFNIYIESFVHNSSLVVFSEPNMYPKFERRSKLFDKWKIDSVCQETASKAYHYLSEVDKDHLSFSRAVFTISASRQPGYYIWQVLFPLFLIVMASWVIFWLKQLGDQLNIAFTLMLTVVAFNFYSATLLPKLPYNTFIETIIISGYVFIFMTIIGIVVQNWVVGKGFKLKVYNRFFRYAFPLIYILSIITIYVGFFKMS